MPCKTVREARKAANLCASCGKFPLFSGVSCYWCLAKNKLVSFAKKLIAFDFYGGRYCAGCYDWRLSVLSIDHIYGGGKAHRRKEKFSDLAVWLYNKGLPDPELYRILCRNCQQEAYAGNPLPNAPGGDQEFLHRLNDDPFIYIQYFPGNYECLRDLFQLIYAMYTEHKGQVGFSRTGKKEYYIAIPDTCLQNYSALLQYAPQQLELRDE
jgi:hypothetical protein